MVVCGPGLWLLGRAKGLDLTAVAAAGLLFGARRWHRDTALPQVRRDAALAGRYRRETRFYAGCDVSLIKPFCGAATALIVVCGLAGCSGAVIDGGAQAQPINHGCVDDSKLCVDQRQAALKTLQADRNKAWVKQPATVGAYATGVRMFAFKTEKARMTCDELSVGRREADGAPGVLRSSQAKGLSPAQVSRSLMFAQEVGKELDRERSRRCADGVGLRRGV
jgi:hypothetical protein